MRFGRIPLASAAGAFLGHTLRLGPGVVLKKGALLGESELASLRAAGHDEVVAAQLDADDLPENQAASLVGLALSGPFVRAAEASTGRSNLHAEIAGLVQLDRDTVDHLNLVDEAVTLATVAPFTPVRAGDLVATVKIIPFAAKRDLVARCADIAARHPLSVAPFRPFRAGLVLTRLPGLSEGVLDRAAAAQRVRALRLGGTIAREIRCAHAEDEVAASLRALLDEGLSPVLVLGASAIVDRGDVIPLGIERAGGALIHLGMPVDPGNLLLLARAGEVPVVGVPGCARSLRRSGFDMVLERIVAGLSPSRGDLMTLGVGGLLSDIPSRPSPRTGDEGLPAARARRGRHRPRRGQLAPDGRAEQAPRRGRGSPDDRPRRRRHPRHAGRGPWWSSPATTRPRCARRSPVERSPSPTTPTTKRG
jgi:molybdenum cofactor cytidylyltransferase